MRTLSCVLIAAAAFGASVSPAIAADHNGYEQIARGDYAKAEHVLVAERRMFPDHADLTLNLAAVYWHTGRLGEARALCQDVLSRPNELLDLSGDRSAWSHDIAKGALQQLGGTHLSAR